MYHQKYWEILIIKVYPLKGIFKKCYVKILIPMKALIKLLEEQRSVRIEGEDKNFDW